MTSRAFGSRRALREHLARGSSGFVGEFRKLREDIDDAFSFVEGGDASWKQTDWYVDWVNGNDNNPGTLAKPVKTVMGGVVGKWGTASPLLQQSTALHMLTSQPRGAERIYLQPRLDGVMFSILGTEILRGSFTLGAVTPRDRSTKTFLQAHGFTGYSPGQFVKNVTPGKESYAQIVGVAGDVAVLSQPLTSMVRGVDSAYFGGVPTNPAPVNTWAQGDSVHVYDMPIINLIDTQMTGPITDTSYATSGIFWLESLLIPDPTGTVGTCVFCPEYDGGYINFQRCAIEPYFEAYAPAMFAANFVNCWMAGGGEGNNITILGGVLPENGYGVNLYGACYIDGDTIAQSWVANWGLLYCGTLAIDTNGETIHHPGASMEIRQNVFAETGFVYGPGTLLLQANSTVVRRLPTVSWASCLNVGKIQFPSQSTVGVGVSYGPPVTFTPNVALTPANLDTYHGLSDPRSQASLSEDL